MYIGGFVGDAVSNVIFNNCRSRAKKINFYSEINKQISGYYCRLSIGGFASQIRGSIANCFADSSIELNFTNYSASTSRLDYVSAGGFAGILSKWIDMTDTPKINECYALGSVTVNVYNNGTSGYDSSNAYDWNTLWAGGFVGHVINLVSLVDGNCSILLSNFAVVFYLTDLFFLC